MPATYFINVLAQDGTSNINLNGGTVRASLHGKQNTKHNKAWVTLVMEKPHDVLSMPSLRSIMRLLVHRKRSPLLQSVLDIEILQAV